MTTPPRVEKDSATSARRSRGRPALPLERIISTALQIVDEEGADALSMRTLAQRLESGTATLYRHFNNRADLIAHVVDRVFGETDLDPAVFTTMNWDHACRTVAQAAFDTLSRHRNVAPLLVEQIPMGPNAMIQRERSIAVLLEGGFTPDLAAHAYTTLARYVLGFAIQLAGSTDQPDNGQLTARFRGLDPTQFPATLAVAGSLPIPLEDEFAFGLELIINGLRHSLATTNSHN